MPDYYDQFFDYLEGRDSLDKDPVFTDEFLRSRNATPGSYETVNRDPQQRSADWFDALLALFGLDGKREMISTSIARWTREHYVLIGAAALALVLLVSGTIGLGASAYQSEPARVVRSVAKAAA